MVDRMAETEELSAKLQTGDTNFIREKSFWRDGNPLPVDEFIEGYLGLHPTPKQKEIWFEIAGYDPYEWSTKWAKAVIAIGMRGGKNHYILAPLTVYNAYKIANMRDPIAYFRRYKTIDVLSKIDMSNHSMVNEKQAANVHFEKTKHMIEHCMLPGGDNWFERYCGLDLRRGIGDLQKKFVTIDNGLTKINMYSFDSTPGAGEGLDLLWFVLDEPSRADTEATYAKADSLWTFGTANTKATWPKGIGKSLAISYLNDSEFDLTDKLLKEAQEEEKENLPRTMFWVNLKTWDTNPNLTKEDFKEFYKNDPTDAEARFEGMKGASRESFYQPHVTKIAECFYEDEDPTVRYSAIETQRAFTDKATGEMQIHRYSAIDLEEIRGDGKIRGIAMDPAEKYDSFVLKCGYVETMDPMQTEIFIQNKPELIAINKKPIIDITIAWQPQRGLPVDFLNVATVLGRLLDKFPNVQFVYTDKWQAVKLIQEVIARGVKGETLGFGNNQQYRLYQILRWLVWNNLIMIRKDLEHPLQRRGTLKMAGEWNQEEHERLIKVNANKVDHPADGGKDFSDVDAILAVKLTELEINTSEGLTGVVLQLMERALVERQKLRNEGVRNREEIIRKLGERLFKTPDEIQAVWAQMQEMFPE